MAEMIKWDGCCPKCESGDLMTTDVEMSENGDLLIGMDCQECRHEFTVRSRELWVNAGKKNG